MKNIKIIVRYLRIYSYCARHMLEGGFDVSLEAYESFFIIGLGKFCQHRVIFHYFNENFNTY